MRRAPTIRTGVRPAPLGSKLAFLEECNQQVQSSDWRLCTCNIVYGQPDAATYGWLLTEVWPRFRVWEEGLLAGTGRSKKMRN